MSVRWMAVQYVGDTLRLPVVNDGDMDKPFGSSVLERDVKRIVVNPFSDSPQTFVPELENAKLRELIGILAFCTNDEAHDCDKCAINGAEMHVTVPEWLFCDNLIERLRTLGFEVKE